MKKELIRNKKIDNLRRDLEKYKEEYDTSTKEVDKKYFFNKIKEIKTKIDTLRAERGEMR